MICNRIDHTNRLTVETWFLLTAIINAITLLTRSKRQVQSLLVLDSKNGICDIQVFCYRLLTFLQRWHESKNAIKMLPRVLKNLTKTGYLYFIWIRIRFINIFCSLYNACSIFFIIVLIIKFLKLESLHQ